MPHRQKQHMGRSIDDAAPQNQRLVGEKGIPNDPLYAVEQAREVSRLLDHEEGYDRPEPRRVRRQHGDGNGRR